MIAMPPQKVSQKISIKPEVFKWLRDSSGYTLEEVSKHLEVTLDQVKRWEIDGKNIPVDKLKELAKVYKRPFTAFLLPKPEKESPIPKDFRKLQGSSPFSKETLYKIRKAQALQEISNELLNNIDQETKPLVNNVNLSDSPEKIALTERELIDFTVEMQCNLESDYKVFKFLRSKIESKNILVFQLSADLEEFRGFALLDTQPFVLVINSSDDIRPRIFTLLHEYGHILLREPSICIPSEIQRENNHDDKVENWCNRFAGAFLLPEENIKKEFNKNRFNYKNIANQYKVSYLSTLTRLITLNLITQKQYLDESNKIISKIIDKDKSSGGSGETSAEKAIRERGTTFVSLVLQNSHQGLITESKALDYLGVKLKNIKELNAPKM